MGAFQHDYHGLAVNLKSWPKNLEKYIKIEKKNCNFLVSMILKSDARFLR